MLLLVKIVLIALGLVGVTVGVPAYAGRRIQRTRQERAVAAVADHRPGSLEFFADLADPLPRPRRRPRETVDSTMAQLRRREALVKANLERILEQAMQQLGLTQAERAFVRMSTGEFATV